MTNEHNDSVHVRVSIDQYFLVATILNTALSFELPDFLYKELVFT
jgi:hypothetical protein